MQRCCKTMQKLLGNEARILSSKDLVDAEIAYVRSTAPIDFIFGWARPSLLYRFRRRLPNTLHGSPTICHSLQR